MIEIKTRSKRVNLDRWREGSVKVGWFEQTHYGNKASTPVARVARAHEFGLGVPRRSFMRPMLRQYGTYFKKRLREQYKEALQTEKSTEAVLAHLGIDVVGKIQEAIMAVHEPALAPATIKRKGHAKPLIDTHTMINTVNYTIEEHEARK